MSWYEVYSGKQTWSDYISTQEQIQGFEQALEKHRNASDGSLSIKVADLQTASSAGLGALTTEVRDTGVALSNDLRNMEGRSRLVSTGSIAPSLKLCGEHAGPDIV